MQNLKKHSWDCAFAPRHKNIYSTIHTKLNYIIRDGQTGGKTLSKSNEITSTTVTLGNSRKEEVPMSFQRPRGRVLTPGGGCPGVRV